MTESEIVELQKGDQTQYWANRESQLQQILSEAELQWNNKPEDPDLLFKWISAMHDLAELYLDAGMTSKTYYYLATPHNWLVSQLHDTNKSQSEIELIIHFMGITFKPLYQFSLQEPCCDNCKRNLEETRLMLNHRQKTVH